MSTLLSIIIVNYKMEALTSKFVKNELVKVAIPHKTVIVNNAATYESDAALCKNLNATLVKLNDGVTPDDNGNLKINGKFNNNDIFVISSAENLGFARGNNLGVEFCRKAFDPYYILFTNNDIKLSENNVVGKLLEKLHVTPKAGVIGPRVIRTDGMEQSPCCYLSCWEREVVKHWSSLFLSKKKQKRRFHLDYAENAHEGFHYFVLGCFFIVRAKDFYNCGMFDSSTFLYAEEKILAERMKAIGKGIYYYPSVSVVHAHGSTTKKYAKNKILKWQKDSNLYYYRVYRHTPSRVLFMAKLTNGLVRLKKRLLFC